MILSFYAKIMMAVIMKNTKLEVVKLTNEDVIATSICNNFSHVLHVKIKSYDGVSNKLTYDVFEYNNGKLILILADHVKNKDDAVSGYIGNGWYYTDDGYNITKCSNQNDAAHPYDVVP